VEGITRTSNDSSTKSLKESMTDTQYEKMKEGMELKTTKFNAHTIWQAYVERCEQMGLPAASFQVYEMVNGN